MSSLISSNEGSPSPDVIEYLKAEAEHFYRSEIHSEQRASWLLTIASGTEALVLNAFVLIRDGKLHERIRPLLFVCSVLLFITIGLALLALWPLAGGRPQLARPWQASAALPIKRVDACAPWEDHYLAHRRRAEQKVLRVVWTLLFLLLGIGAGSMAVVMNAGVI